MKNRLNLNFNLQTAEERLNYVNHYLSEDPEVEGRFPYAPTSEELETIANYVLYGKTSSDARFDVRDRKGVDGVRSVVAAGYVQIDSRNTSWSARPEDSLESLYEAEGASPETQFNFKSTISGKPASTKTVYKNGKQPVFDREATRRELLAKHRLELLSLYEDLWTQIDEVEYAVALYEIKMGRRKTKLEVRPELVARLNPQQIAAATELVTHLNIYSGGKLKHHLVELRRQQYAYRDSYRPTILNTPYTRHASEPERVIFPRILPLGGPCSGTFNGLLFAPELSPTHFSAPFQDYLSKLIATNEALTPQERLSSYDFTNINHVALLIYNHNDISNDSISADFYEDQEYWNQFTAALNFYISRANLKPFQFDLIRLKIAGWRNEDIAQYISKHYGKLYRTNYISTIFRDKCCKEITKAAQLHLDLMRSVLKGKQHFKICSECGQLLLKNADYFIRRKSARDGLSGFCKNCSKLKRLNKPGATK